MDRDLSTGRNPDSAEPGAVRRPGGWRPDLLVPAAMVVAAAAAAAAGAPGWVSAPLTALAAAMTIGHVVRRPDRSVLESVVRGAGGLVLVLIALGFVLDATPGGLTSVSWSVAAGLLGLGCLAGCARRPSTTGTVALRPSRLAAGSVWYLAAAVLLCVAFTVSVRATDRAERPPLALSVQRSSADSAEVAISAGTTGGAYQLVVDDGGASPTVAGPFVVAAGASVLHTVALPAGQRVSVALVASGSTQPLRSLILQGPGAVSSTPPVTTPPVTTPPTAPTAPPSAPVTAPTTTPAPTPPVPSAPTQSSPTPTMTPPVLGSASPLVTAPVLGPASALSTAAVQLP